MLYDVAVIGAGIAGMTAAIYALRAGKSVVMFEKESIGGQIALSPKVENYPGFAAVSGLDLSDGIFNQALSLGAALEVDEVLEVIPKNGIFGLRCAYGEHEARAVVLATGLKHRKLEAAQSFEGRGVSYCAVCDGMFYKGKTVAVVGGGNTAVSEAIYLADICDKVYLIHRRTGYRAEKAVMDRFLAKENIIRLENKVVENVTGDKTADTLVLKDTLDGSLSELHVDGLFVALGHVPQSAAFEGLVDIDGDGFMLADESCKTKTPGLFIAGDCRRKAVRQLTTAAADGACAGLAAAKYVDGL